MNVYGGYQNSMMMAGATSSNYGGGYGMGTGMGMGQMGGSNFSSMFGMASNFGSTGFGYGAQPSSYSGMSAGGATSSFLGGQFSFSRTPVYQQQAHQRALFENYTAEQKKITQGSAKMWDVWFDHKDGQKTKRLSPIVLDLNGDGKAGITGKNVLGDGKVSGDAVNFDIDPSRSAWSKKSLKRRPGKGAPKVKGGHWEGNQYLDKDDKVLGEKRGKFYHWGKKTTQEKTEWLSKNGGDGMLVWDKNKDDKITSSKELFGNFDANGKKKFKNGYEKLAHYFDKNEDGKVTGKELKGLKIWKDANGNGKTDKGELQSLKGHNITSLNTKFKEDDMSADYGTTKETVEKVQRERLKGYDTTFENVFSGWQDNFSFALFGGASQNQWAGGHGCAYG